MEKTITLKLKDAIFLRNIMEGTVKASNEADLIMKIKFFDSVKAIKEEIKSIQALPEEEIKALDEAHFEQERTLTIDSEVLDWTKAKWATVPAEYKITNMKTGEVVQTGLASEEECRSVYDVKMALEDARLVK